MPDVHKNGMGNDFGTRISILYLINYNDVI